jgi:hypothetical protein
VKRKEDPWLPLITVLVLLGLNTFHLQYLATVKTYALAGLLLTSGLGCVLRFHRGGGNGWLAGGALLLALAAGTRLSLVLFLPAVGLELLIRRPNTSAKSALVFAGASVAALATLLLPFALIAPEAVQFGWFEYHAGRETGNPLLLRAAFVSRVLRNYLPFALAALPLCLRRGRWLPGMPGIAGGAVAVTLVHALSPFPYDDYQAAVMPAFALVLALQLPSVVISPERRLQVSTGLTLFGLLFAAASPQWQDWFTAGRDRIWWNVSTRSPLADLHDAAARVHELDPEADTLFTPDAYLAIEANLDVPVELNMGPFGYLPGMETERAKRLHVLNTPLLLGLIRTTDAPIAALSGYAFTIEAPGITPTPPDTLSRIHAALLERYEKMDSLETFGQARTPLAIYRER